ncbi:hypothetical protein ABB37_09461 [Leptomonas pyrrhocoris]|uniref:Methylated-DNA--protein-cysteine methyltransferase n=1 Tax=Leptomonas pyrrhocoris TaxID=157538 RepID=A0A0N0VD34_LEPPY|nr:hypothetical protein ABB37_09461 [Leptomonas pyrrhocoris]KPA74208.1 hypothetical protein ABB37_09461 [Leptomonas pyrrhocoris]|eukprot:XP_015652647.1 hypothetical protein ABB37_09461 [Leptomonas pyrrhocoris]
MTAQHKIVKRAVRAVAAAAAAKKEAAAAASATFQKSHVQAARSRAAPTERLQLFYHAVATPLGPFSLYVDGDGAIRCCHWQHSPPGDVAALMKEQRDVCAALQSRWYKNASVEMAKPSSTSTTPGEKAATLLYRYFNPSSADAGRPAALEKVLLQVPVAYPPTTAFMTTTWDVLRQTVPSGETISYKGLGVRVSQALSHAPSSFSSSSVAVSHAAPRAIGVAMGANPIPVIVPCHRVLSSTNALRGYALGLRYKVWLLRHEQADVPTEKLRSVEFENAVSSPISLR